MKRKLVIILSILASSLLSLPIVMADDCPSSGDIPPYSYAFLAIGIIGIMFFIIEEEKKRKKKKS